MTLMLASKSRNATTSALTTRPAHRATFGVIPGEAPVPPPVACPCIPPPARPPSPSRGLRGAPGGSARALDRCLSVHPVLRPSPCIDYGQYTDFGCFLQPF